ncbi:CoA-acylating methylmalonate-semialdehyde dehydrogenase [Candidatus Calescamantes bacterium]|nr:CoA-acylating methylmalonate-semialdehyde dehydrogenase [Candidatus Calescamantes bacterium]
MEAERIYNYIDGEWVEGSGNEIINVENPATTEILAQYRTSTPEDVKKAVEAAKKAFLEWREVPTVERCRFLFKLYELLKKNREELAKTITMEHGKEYPASLGEMRRAIEMVEAACSVPSLMKGDFSENISKDIDEYQIRVPIGVFAMIAPFNFPAMVPLWFMPWAVACGNTYIIKPSPLVPITQFKIFQLIEKCEFPRGVINLVGNGEGVPDELLKNKDIVGISSVTSTPTAREIYKKAAENGKRVQCHGGANNFLVVMPDANLDKVIPNMIGSCFGNTGQRCLAGSIILVVGNIYKEFKERFLESAKALKIGYGLEEGVDIGPVISKEALNKLHASIEKGVREGANLILDGRNIKIEKYPHGYFLGPTIFEGAEPGMHIFDEEIFGPVVCIKRVKSLQEAISIANSSKFGNAATIYTQNGRWARQFQYKIECGNVGINVGIVAPMAFYPFAGMKDSFFGDLHGQAQDAIDFFTHKKVVISRWF